MLDEIESKIIHEDEKGDQYWKKKLILSEVKPVEKLSKNT